MYFRLNPEIIFVTGKNGSVLCDCFNEKIFHLNINETKCLIDAESNLKINSNEKLFNKLEYNCLGTFYDEIPYIHKFAKIEFANEPIEEISFKNFFLEISSKCNNECYYCASKNKFNRSLGCLGCNLFDEKDDPLLLIEYYEIIDTIEKLGCDNLFLVGGDLTLDINLTREIIEYCSNKSFNNIFIISSFKNNYKKLLNFLNDGINLIIQIEYEELKFISDKRLMYLLVISEEEQKYLKNQNVLNEFIVFIDFLSCNNLTNPNLDNNFSFSLDSFYPNINFHPCLGKTLFVSRNGNVYPCPLYRFKKFGNIKNDSMFNFLKNNKKCIYDFWRMNLDFIDGCNLCEFRYLCSDCRACEENISKMRYNKLLCHLG